MASNFVTEALREYWAPEPSGEGEGLPPRSTTPSSSPAAPAAADDAVAETPVLHRGKGGSSVALLQLC